MPHTKFTSLESFAHIYRGQKRFLDPELKGSPAKVRYGAKVKLRGTNAAVRIDPDGCVIAQGRNRDIYVHEDQFGFARWVDTCRDAWSAYGGDMRGEYADGAAVPIIVHGEWAGKGIQKKDAVTQLDDKFFFVFAVQIGEDMLLDSDMIEELIPDLCQLLVLPWHIESHDELDFSDAVQCGMYADWANARAEEVGEKDPFISEVFEIDGPGEGLVFVPFQPMVSREWYDTLSFKAKTVGHNVKAGKAAQRDLVIPEGVPEFIELFVTDARCEQALTEGCGGVAEPERTGDFLKWIGQDIKKESVAELEDSGLEWKDVSKLVANTARAWFLKKCGNIT